MYSAVCKNDFPLWLFYADWYVYHYFDLFMLRETAFCFILTTVDVQ